MWSLYVVVDQDLLRLGMNASGGLDGPHARRTLAGNARSVQWLPGPRALAVHTDVATFIVSEDFQKVRELPPLSFASPDGTLGFAADGHREAKDLVVAPLKGGNPYVVADIGWLPGMGYCFVPEIDALVLVLADANADTGRNLAVIPMAQLREWGNQGVTRATTGDLDYDNLIGVRLQLPQDLPVGLSPILNHPGFFVHWHSKPTAGGATEATLLEIEYPYWSASSNARSQVRLMSRHVTLDRCWVSHVETRAMKQGGRVVLAIGSGRRANDFVLGVRKLTLHDPNADLRTSLSTGQFVDIRSRNIELRHAGGLDGIFGLPNGRGMLVRAEDPKRQRRLYRVDVGPNEFAETLLDFDVTPEAFCLVADDEVPRPQLAEEVRPQLAPAFRGEITARVSLRSTPPLDPEPTAETKGAEDAAADLFDDDDALDNDVIEVEVTEATAPPVRAAAPAPATAPPATAPSATAPLGAAQAGWRVLWSGTLPVVPGVGLDLPVGLLPADAVVLATVIAVGDAKQAQLRYWVSQGGATGDVLYQLHLRADSVVQARCAVYHVTP